MDEKIRECRELVLANRPGTVIVSSDYGDRVPDLSVIVGTYKADNQLIRALKSVDSQDFEGIIEILLSYDYGTPPATLEIITDWIRNIWKGNTLIKIVFHEPMRLFRDREFMTTQTTSRFVTFLDYDNTFDRNNVSTHISLMKERDYHFTFSNQRDVDIEGNVIREIHLEVPKNYIDPEMLLFRNFVDSNTIFFDRYFYDTILVKVYRSVKDPFFDGIIEDYFYGMVASLTGNLHYIDKTLGSYTYHKGNITSRLYNVNSPEEYVRIAYFNERVQKTITAITMVNSSLKLSNIELFSTQYSIIQQRNLQFLGFHVGFNGQENRIAFNVLKAIIKVTLKLPYLRTRFLMRKHSPNR